MKCLEQLKRIQFCFGKVLVIFLSLRVLVFIAARPCKVHTPVIIKTAVIQLPGYALAIDASINLFGS